MKKPIFLPRLALPKERKTKCGCKINMEFKKAVLTWLVDQGDTVCRGEILCEAEVEKSVIEICAFADGILVEICVDDGRPCDISAPIGFLKVEE